MNALLFSMKQIFISFFCIDKEKANPDEGWLYGVSTCLIVILQQY